MLRCLQSDTLPTMYRTNRACRIHASPTDRTTRRGTVKWSSEHFVGYPSRSASLSDTKQLRSRSNTMLKRHVEEGTGPKFGRKDRFSSFQRETVLARLKAGIMRVRGTSV